MNRFLSNPRVIWGLTIVIGILVISGIYVSVSRHIRNINTIIRYTDTFKDVSDSPTTEEIESANTNYAGLLLFLKKYPTRAIPFIKDVKDKLYGDSCTVRPDIDFENLAKFPNGMVFV